MLKNKTKPFEIKFNTKYTSKKIKNNHKQN